MTTDPARRSGPRRPGRWTPAGRGPAVGRIDVPRAVGAIGSGRRWRTVVDLREVPGYSTYMSPPPPDTILFISPFHSLTIQANYVLVAVRSAPQASMFPSTSYPMPFSEQAVPSVEAPSSQRSVVLGLFVQT